MCVSFFFCLLSQTCSRVPSTTRTEQRLLIVFVNEAAERLARKRLNQDGSCRASSGEHMWPLHAAADPAYDGPVFPLYLPANMACCTADVNSNRTLACHVTQ